MNLFAFLTPKFWIDRDRRLLEEQYEHGWNWAAGNLLRGVTALEVLRHPEAARVFDCETEFDIGAREAVRVWLVMGGREYGLPVGAEVK